jgi:hypothetical protein
MMSDDPFDIVKALAEEEARQWINVQKVASGHLTITVPEVRSVLHASPYLTMTGAAPMPNWFRRFWYWALLGWTWRKP